MFFFDPYTADDVLYKLYPHNVYMYVHLDVTALQRSFSVKLVSMECLIFPHTCTVEPLLKDTPDKEHLVNQDT